MNIVILGPPASGKGTYSDYLSQRYNFVHISMGDLLRSAVKNGSIYSTEITIAIENGQILDEKITASILKEYLETNNLYDNILLDGYPRGMLSVEYLNEFLNIDAVIKLEADEEVIKYRVLNRLRCIKCGKTFNKQIYKESICDDCSGDLKQREDDTIETLTKRIEVYKSATVPVLDYYENQNILYKVDGNCSIEEGCKRIDNLLKKLLTKK